MHVRDDGRHDLPAPQVLHDGGQGRGVLHDLVRAHPSGCRCRLRRLVRRPSRIRRLNRLGRGGLRPFRRRLSGPCSCGASLPARAALVAVPMACARRGG